MKRYMATALAGGLLLAAGACKDNPVAPSTDRVVAGSQQTLQSLITGIVASDRAATAAGSYLVYGGIMARDAIVPTANEPRYTKSFYESPPDPSDFIGGSQWTGYYTTIRAAHNLLKDPAFTGLSAGDQAATSGFLRTLIAADYIKLLEYRDVNGIVIQGDDPGTLDPIRTKQSALAYISALLDSAQADLSAASSAGVTSVPFTLPSGYKLHGDYNQIANLLLLNRGLKGKAEVFRALDPTDPNPGSAQTAITALNAALADAPATPTQDYLNKGPWYQFNPSAPESYSNPLPSSTYLLTDNFVNSIMPGDARASQIIPATPQKVDIYEASHRLKITDPSSSANLSAPIPMIRNAEFYLLRAQAEIAAGLLPAASADINVVHTVEGGLTPYATFTTATAAIDAVLYEYRYSFAYQGPQHLVALREYQRLNDAYISQPGIPTPGAGKDALVQTLPITKAESDARGGDITPTP